MTDFFVIGGTGTLGEAFTRKAIANGKTVTCFSRCELKQKDLAARLDSNRVKYVLGDIRDADSLIRAMRNHEHVFHFAALKHVDTLEHHPDESVKTNVLGTMNVLDACWVNEIKTLVFSSTDKAVDPINAYGFSKALSEKLIQARQDATEKRIFRWGNVAASRGSAIPLFIRALKNGEPVNITSKDMTRFWIKIEEAVQFIWDTFDRPTDKKILVPGIKAAKVTEVVRAIATILGVKTYKEHVIGLRPGEKIHERLLSEHEGYDIESSNPAYAFTFKDLVKYLEPIVVAEVKK